MLKTTLSFLLFFAFCGIAQAKNTPQHVATDTFKRAIILLKGGDTLKICDAKSAEKMIEFRYVDMPKKVKLIEKKHVIRVLGTNGDIIYDSPELVGKIVQPKLSAYIDLLGFPIHKMGEKEVNPYVFEKELVENIREGAARRQSVYDSIKKVRKWNSLSFVGLALTLIGFAFFPLLILGAAFIIGCFIAVLIHNGNANSKYQKMIDDYNTAQGYN